MSDESKIRAGEHVRVLLTPLEFGKPLIRGYALITRVREIPDRADSDESWQASEALLRK